MFKMPWSVDQQSRKSFVSGDMAKAGQVQISSCDAGGTKRFCTVQFGFTGDGSLLPRVAVIFRGQGRVYERERARYHPAVIVHFQPKAWADRPTAIRLLDDQVTSYVTEKFGTLGWCLYVDSLDSQRTRAFVGAVKKTNGQVVIGPPGKTDGWQPLDLGVGAILKSLYRSELDEWLEGSTRVGDQDIPNWQRWEAGLLAADKRCLVTWWLGTAYEKFTAARYKHARLKAWSSGGALAGIEPASAIHIRGLGRLFNENAATVIDDHYKSYHFSGHADFRYNDAPEEEPPDDDSSSSLSDSDSNSSSS